MPMPVWRAAVVWLPLKMIADDSVGAGRSLFSEESAYMIADVLGGDERSGELVGHMADVVLPRIAWKSGTSAGHRDAWVVAYNPEYVVGVWLGNPDGSASDALVGGHAAGPVAGEIFRRLYPEGHSPWFRRPDGVASRRVCAREVACRRRHHVPPARLIFTFRASRQCSTVMCIGRVVCIGRRRCRRFSSVAVCWMLRLLLKRLD